MGEQVKLELSMTQCTTVRKFLGTLCYSIPSPEKKIVDYQNSGKKMMWLCAERAIQTSECQDFVKGF